MQHRRWAYWAAVLCTALGVVFLAFMVAAALSSPILEWFGEHPEQVPGLWYVVVASALLFLPSFILLLAGIHCDAPPERRTLSLAALAFALVATAMLGLVYAIQLTVVRLGIAAGATAGLAQFISTNTASASAGCWWPAGWAAWPGRSGWSFRFIR